jgi:hypothetical protein
VKTISNARRVTGVIMTAVALSACGNNDEVRPVPIGEVMSALGVPDAGVDRGCILSAADELRRLTRLEAADGRALPSPVARSGVQSRLIELDTTNVGMKVTYVFACSVSNKTGYTVVSPLGHK